MICPVCNENTIYHDAFELVDPEGGPEDLWCVTCIQERMPEILEENYDSFELNLKKFYLKN